MKRVGWVILIIALWCMKAQGRTSPGEWKWVQIDAEFTSLLLTDEVGVYTAEGVAAPDSVQLLGGDQFQRNASANLTFGLTQKDHWLKFNLVNTGEQRRQLLLELVNPNLRSVAVYQYWKDQRLQADTTGNDLPFAHRPFPHQNFLFPADLPSGDSLTFLIRVSPSYQPVNFNLYLWDRHHRTGQQAVKESFSLGSFFLLHFIFLSLLALISWGFGIRELWYYTAYVLFGALFVLADLGLGYRLFWGEWPYMQKIAPFFLVNVYTILGTQFIRRFFRTKRRFAGFDKVFQGVMISAAALSVVALFVPALPLHWVHNLSIFQYAVYLICSVSFVLLFIRTIPMRHQSGWFLLGFSLHGAGIFITILQYLKLLPNFSASAWFFEAGWPVTFFTQTTMMAGMIMEIPIMLYIAFRRFRYLEHQNTRQAERLASLRKQSIDDLLLGIESERRRLAQDLHDGLSVNLAAIKMKANLMEVRSQSAEDRKAWKEIMRDLENAYEELRRISHDLPPKSLFRVGLGGALEEAIQRARTLRPEIDIQYFNNLPLLQLSKQAEINLYRIAMELINNSLKHAEASFLSLQLIQHDNQVVVTLEDNGKGFNPQKVEGEGIGLKNIRNRVGVLGGTLEIDSQPGRGAVFVISIPSEGLYTT
ncbi:MAG: 7TM-DISM domain-containing protein [Saprospiraceae bacterium]